MAQTTTTNSGVEQEIRPRFRPDIQGLRAVAVLLVVANHGGIQQLAGGFVGVDVFFVISGFLITGLLVKEAQLGRGISLSNFYARRARRILPAATLVLVATVGAAMVLLGSVRASEVGREAFWSALFSVNWKFAIDGTDYFASGLPPSPLQHYWSLSVEEQFYLVWPALFALLLVLFVGRASMHRRRRRVLTSGHLLGAAGVIGLITAGSLGYSILATAESPNAAFFSTFTRVFELGVGALLAILLPQLSYLPGVAKAVLSWLGLAGIAVSAVIFSDATAFPGAIALLPVLSAALVIVGGMGGGGGGGAGILLAIPPMRWVGDRSYSLYLWYWPFLVIAAAYLGRDLTGFEAAALVAAALLATVVTYALIEYPIHKGRLQSTRATSLVLWPASFAFVAVVSLVAVDAAKSVPGGTDPAVVFSPAPTAPAATSGTQPGPETGTAPPGSVEAAVAEAVAIARVSGPIPPTMTPPLDQLRADTWETVAPCAAETNQTTTDICGYGPSDAGRSMVVIGDSHAGMWVQTLKQIAETAGWRFYYFVKGGCSSADIVLVGSGREGRQDSCQEWRSWALDQIADLSPDIAILADRGDKPFVDPDGNEIPVATPEHDQAWEAAVTSTITTLKGDGVGRVIMFAETPIMNRDGVTCLGAVNADLGDCLTPLAASIQGTAAAGQRAAAAAGGEYLDVNRWLCAEKLCPMVVSDIIVYTDGQHLTLTYATALAETMKVALALT
ncbi:MAG: acyltransferase family protein [Geodermatophilaceae bacterium]